LPGTLLPASLISMDVDQRKRWAVQKRQAFSILHCVVAFPFPFLLLTMFSYFVLL
jgi:hypothetical protein